jgi:hypothetical protein
VPASEPLPEHSLRLDFRLAHLQAQVLDDWQSASDGYALLFSTTEFGGTVQSSIAQANRPQ